MVGEAYLQIQQRKRETLRAHEKGRVKRQKAWQASALGPTRGFRPGSRKPVLLPELQLPSIASLRAIAALRSPHLALVRRASLGLGFELESGNQKTLAEIEEVLGGPGRLALPYSLRWLLDMLTGLGVLHRALGFVHGEVQPENIVIGDDGVGRLVPVVRAHWVRGAERAPERLYYLAPEKLLGDRLDVRSDVFSIGVMLWEALAGRRLMDADNVERIIAHLMGGNIPSPIAPETEAWALPLAAVAEKAIAVDPARRFGSLAEMKAALESACSRHLASTPDMAKLVEDPSRAARAQTRSSLLPESQRVTLPPAAPVEESAALSAGAVAPASTELLDAAAERLSRSSFSSIDLEEETMAQSVADPAPQAARGTHSKTLLGVQPAFGRDSAPPDQEAVPAREGPSSAARRADPSTGSPVRATSIRPASLAPLVAAPPGRPSVGAAEPSFELVRPRRRRGVGWLLLAAAAVIPLFAARPWLRRQVAPASDGQAEAAAAKTEARTLAAAPSVASGNAPAAPASSTPSSAIGIAATPPSPATEAARLRPTEGEARAPLEPPAARQQSAGAPKLTRATPQREVGARTPPPAAPAPPPAAPAPPPAAPSPPPPPSRPKSAPVSEADRYGI